MNYRRVGIKGGKIQGVFHRFSCAGSGLPEGMLTRVCDWVVSFSLCRRDSRFWTAAAVLPLQTRIHSSQRPKSLGTALKFQ